MKRQKKAITIYRERSLLAFGLIMFLFLLLLIRVAYIQVVKADEYRDMAVSQQTSDIPIQSKRGSIYDSKGIELATSALVYSVWLRPAQFRDEYNKEDEAKHIKELAKITGKNEEDLTKAVSSKETLVKIAKYLDKESIDKVKKLGLTGVETSEDNKRYYPFGNFASQLLGSVTDENEGRTGVEYQFDGYLSGVNGRMIKQNDINGNALAYGQELYYGAENGYNVVLTIDSVLQHYAEDAVKNTLKESGVDSSNIIVMNPKNGDILAMASTGGFDPNDPMVPADEEEKKDFEKLSQEEQSAYLSNMWKSPIVSNVYEPGSTFKVITTSMALEEKLVSPESNVYCDAGYDVAGIKLHCHKRVGHGAESLTQAIFNSCNPVQIKLAQQLGEDTYYKYLDLLGINRKTGISLPGEANPVIKDKETIGPVDYATMSYGQGIAVTPLQLLTAECAVANNGVLMKPRIVKELTDSNGEVVKSFPVKEERKVFSKETTEEMRTMMEYVITGSKNWRAHIEGYRIAGKTGTANVPEKGKYGDSIVNSCVIMVPAEDPQIAILATVRSTGIINYALSATKDFNLKALPYLGIQPTGEVS